MSEQEGGGGGDKSEDSSSSSSSSKASSSPPRVDDSPLQKCMDRNKQSLKVKLMMRRPYLQLVDQGIMPPLKTPASFHEQRQKLQRAKMGDLLKHKIQHRPDRTELIRQHILEADTGKLDPSLAERQRMLKRARLADALNDQLSHRPGPLELIQKNILHTDENVERAVKEGQIAFRATCEGSAIRPTHPFRYVTPEGDDSSSEGALSPSSLDGCTAGLSGGASSAACSSPATMASSSPSSSLSSGASPVVVSSPPPPPPLILAQVKLEQVQPPPPPPSPTTAQVVVKTAAEITSAKNRQRKKSKQKCPPKPRTIKFHEYKGPPNAHQKPAPPAPSDAETSYELLLQQQQLFLQWQLEWQHKYPQIILPAKATAGGAGAVSGEAAANLATFLAATAPPTSSSGMTASSSGAAPSPAPSNTEASISSSTVTPNIRLNSRLEDMKVNDLKGELKKRNLPVSGSKPQLIERLKPFVGEDGILTASKRSVSRRGSQTQLVQQQQSSQSMMTDEGPMPSPPPPLSNSSSQRRISCSSLDGSISSFRASGENTLFPSLSPMSSAASYCMSPSPPSVRPPSVVNMDVDIEMSDASCGSNTLDGTNVEVKREGPPTPPPLPVSLSSLTKTKTTAMTSAVPSVEQQQQAAEQQIDDLVRGLQEEQRILQEQQQVLRQQAAASVIEEQQEQVSVMNPNDPKFQQRLLLQQHLQLKIQQQQIQQQLEQLQQLQQIQQQQQKLQKQSPQPTTPSAKSNKTTTTTGRTAVTGGRNGRTRLIASRSATQLSTPATENPVSTAPSPMIRPPPPNYTEASRLLQQPTISSAKPKVSIKSQLVDDVLDILIRNGELPPSAIHDPVTPTTVSRDPPPLPPPPPSHLLSSQQQQQQPHHSVAEIPYIDINDLGLNLDLESLGEAMELGVYDNHSTQQQTTSHQHPMQNYPTPSSGGRVPEEVTAMEMDVSEWLDTLLPPLGVSTSQIGSLPISSADGSSGSSSTSSSTSGFSSLGSSEQSPHHSYLMHNSQQQQLQMGSSLLTTQQLMSPLGSQHISGDPLFSSLSGSDPYTDLFVLEDNEMKLPVGPLGNTLSWDRLDFTA